MPQITGQLCNYFRVRLFANTAGVVKMTAKCSYCPYINRV